ncbi:MAG: hypothetical protein GY796_16135 [Chloroflexi bacterium]|nr:hypothetical protein [Chloroflexota bacterium]
MMWRRVVIGLQLGILLLGGLLLFVREWPAFGTEDDQLKALVSQEQFDFLVWETEAFLAKAEAALANGHSFLSQTERKQTVLDYLELLHQVQVLEWEINQIYVNPDMVDSQEASAELQVELMEKRAAMVTIRPLAEAIVQDQVSDILVAEGFDLVGQAWPPVLMHMTPLPTLLVVSPRDQIERTHQFSLTPDLSTLDKEVLETAVYNQLNLSALTVPLGGLGTYPAMIQETSNLNWLAEVTAHEWSHHWLTFYPVGLLYNDPQVRVINETIASIIDREIGSQMIEKYYPELIPPPPPENPPPPPEPDPNAPPPFDFRAEMAATRVQVDDLLADGKIDAAEEYMETRRHVFVENGYNIRKLNQAYFAFYGAYSAEPGGAGGSDPTGPMLRDIRTASPTLHDFMATVAPIASFEDLERIWQETMMSEQ